MANQFPSTSLSQYVGPAAQAVETALVYAEARRFVDFCRLTLSRPDSGTPLATISEIDDDRLFDYNVAAYATRLKSAETQRLKDAIQASEAEERRLDGLADALLPDDSTTEGPATMTVSHLRTAVRARVASAAQRVETETARLAFNRHIAILSVIRAETSRAPP